MTNITPHPPLQIFIKTTDKATYLLTRARYNIYESGDEAGKLLAQQARQSASSRLIHKVHDRNGESITNHLEINDVFKQYYSFALTAL